MIFGNINGLVDGVESIVFDYTVSGSAVQTISTGNILNGNEDGFYRVLVSHVSGASSDVNRIRFNADAANNYGYRGIQGTSTTIQNFSATASGIYIAQGTTPTNTSFGEYAIDAKSGSFRKVIGMNSYAVSSSTVTGMVANNGVWNNSADNITSITYASDVASGIGIGTRLVILKTNNFTDGIPAGKITANQIQGSWVRVGSSVLSATASTVSISGLDGNRDIFYYFNSVIKASATGYPSILPNGTSSNKGNQYITASATAAAASRSTTEWNVDYSGTNSGRLCQIQGYISAATGQARHILSSMTSDTTGVLAGRVTRMGGVWNETSTNITSLSWEGSVAGMFGIGSKFEVYALRPNG